MENGDMYGVDMAKPGAQEYYNSVFQLIAAWDVDFVKVDDLGGRQPENSGGAGKPSITAARPMVFSISPGPMPLDQGEFAAEHAKHVAQSATIFGDKLAGAQESVRSLCAVGEVQTRQDTIPMPTCYRWARFAWKRKRSLTFHQRRTANDDDAMGDFPFAADDGRRHAQERRFHACRC